ncbi:MAG: NAD-dependent protein deacylase [Lachnospiraceae bacterium]
MDAKIRELSQILQRSHRIVFFGGAGCSCASGIPDFRSSDGLYSKNLNRYFTPEQAVSHSFFVEHPEDFYEFYKENLVYPDAKPNDCHIALARLEEMGKLSAIVTQNIDGLHQAAGSKNVYELHGSVLRNYCMSCHASYDVDTVLQADGVPKCPKCGGVIKPDVVLYEEGLDQEILDGAIHEISCADTLIIGGTSLVVYPAAGLVRYFHGRNLVLINKSVTEMDKNADLVINDDIAAVMREAVIYLTSTPSV